VWVKDKVMTVRQSFIGVAALALSLLGSAVSAEDFRVPFDDTPHNRELVRTAQADFERTEREHGRFVDLGDVRMHYLEWGDKRGTALIWSPGMTSTGYQISPIGEALAKAGYHVIAVDHRAHGLTVAPNLDFTLYTMADDLAGLMDHLKIRCAVMAGGSLGGFATAAFYDDYPERVLGLVMGDGGVVPWQSYLEQNYETSIAMYRRHATETASFGGWSYADPFDAFRAAANERLEDLGHPMSTAFGAYIWSTLKRDASGRYEPATPFDSIGGTLPDRIDPAAGYRNPPLMRSMRSMIPETIFRKLDVPMLIIDPAEQPFKGGEEASAALARQHPKWVQVLRYPETPHPFVFVRPDWTERDLKAFLPRVKATKRPGC
jgi:pimeloyl-ACP methyl ester carboxylesterase